MLQSIVRFVCSDDDMFLHFITGIIITIIVKYLVYLSKTLGSFHGK